MANDLRRPGKSGRHGYREGSTEDDAQVPKWQSGNTGVLVCLFFVAVIKRKKTDQNHLREEGVCFNLCFQVSLYH